VVDFTPMSADMSPVELVELLNEVFSHFDGLVEKYELEKIKTIGDCYMVASGIPRPRADHAQAVTHMGLEILRFVETGRFRGRKLTFRIGINSGPVVAGVIGQKKFSYDLWGDAVNTASRMESQGISNHIQITRATYELIKEDFRCQPQKPIHIKGKGEMEIWHVLGAKA
jgi:guanylate cyclase